MNGYPGAQRRRSDTSRSALCSTPEGQIGHLREKSRPERLGAHARACAARVGHGMLPEEIADGSTSATFSMPIDLRDPVLRVSTALFGETGPRHLVDVPLTLG